MLDILSWNSVIPKGNTHPYPMFYIKHDDKLIEYAKKSDYMVVVTVHGTGKYDDKPLMAVINSTAYFPNYRPYFYNSTGYLSVTVFSNWLGYPENNGTADIVGITDIELPKSEPLVPKAIPPFPSSGDMTEGYVDRGEDKEGKEIGKCKLSDCQLVIIGLLLFIVLLLVA